MSVNNRIIFVAGPTAAGKSAVAIEIARQVSGAVVSCDAMQVYKEAAIASNKPSAEMLSRADHYMLDIVSVEEEYNAGKYYQSATACINSLLQNNCLPVVAGGTGLYLQVLIDGIFETPDISPDFRNQLMKEAEELGQEHLYEQLREVDPKAAEKIHPNDLKRILRALEVYRSEGRPISVKQQERAGLAAAHDVSMFVLNTGRAVLYERINARVDEMFEAGLVDEVRRLSELNLSRTAAAMIGIPEVKGYLGGEYTLKDAKELMKKNTRNFAKRQLTWFRKDPRWRWIEAEENEPAAQTAGRIMEIYESEQF